MGNNQVLPAPSPQESSSALCNLASCWFLQNYQEFNILESSATAIVNWNCSKYSKARVFYVGKGGGGKGLHCMINLMWRWESRVVMLKIFLAVLSLSDPDKKKCFLSARKKEAAVTVLVVSSKAAMPSVFGSQKCTATPKHHCNSSDSSRCRSLVKAVTRDKLLSSEQSARRWWAGTFQMWAI